MQHILRTFRLLAWLAWLVPVVTWAAPTPVFVRVPVRPYPSTQTAIPSLAATTTATSGVTSYNITTVMPTAQGTVYVNGAAVTAARSLTPAQAAQLTFVPASGFRGNAVFQYTATDGDGTSTAVSYSIPVSGSSCGTANTNSLDFSVATKEDWKNHAAVSISGTTLSTSGYSAPYATVTNSFQVADASNLNNSNPATNATGAGVDGQGLIWYLSSTTYANDNNAAKNDVATVTFTFSRPVNNLSLAVEDIDNNTNFQDEVTFDGYANTSTNTPITLSASNFGLGTNNTNAFGGTNNLGNTVRGTATNNDDNGTITLTFPSAVQKLILTYRNTAGNTGTTARSQAISIPSMSWCAQTDLAVVFASVPPSSVAAGSTVSYAARYTNNGVDDVNSATGLIQLPSGATNVNTNGVGTYDATNNTITYVGGLANKNSYTANFSFTLPSTTGTYPVTASVSTTADDPVSSNNTASTSLTTTATGASGTPAPCGNPGKDGSPSGLSGTINTYFAGTSSAAAGSNSISVAASGGATTPIAVGDLLLVIQMQGADINSDNTTNYGAASGSGSGNLANSNFTAGTYEYVVASSALAANTAGTINLVTALVNGYSTSPATTTASRRSFQVVRIPQYTNVTLGGQLNALAWNGTIGGILAMDVAGTLNLNGQTMNAAALGFRGGAGRVLTGSSQTGLANTDYRTPNSLTVNGSKGEGTAGTPRYTLFSLTSAATDNTTNQGAFTNGVTDGYPNGDYGKGAPGNAGGGATDDVPSNNGINSGGAGGANGGGGGLGGWPRINNTVSPLTINTNNQAPGGTLFNVASSSRLVMGGGGGAGSTNNGSGDSNKTGIYSSGAPGGGIIMVRTGSLSGTGTANASGGGGYLLDATVGSAGGEASGSGNNDGGGGGGAGGSVLITSRQPGGLTGLTVLATGGNGTSNKNTTDVSHGPGGGGGGGIIFTNAAINAASSAAAGAPGTVTSNDRFSGTAYGAGTGANGIRNNSVSLSVANSVTGASCVTEVTTSLTGPTTLSAGQPTGTYTATFTNEGPQPATSVTQTVTLPTGALLTATQQQTIRNAYPNAAFSSNNNAVTINFGTATSLAAGSANAFSFAFTAPTATGSSTITANTSTTSNEGANVAPNAAQLALTTTAQADALATIAYSAASVAPGATATLTATFSNNGPQTAASAARTVQLPAGLTNVVVKDNNGNTLANAYNSSTGLVTYPTSDQATGAGTNYASTITFTAPASGVVPATASISSATPDGNSTNNVASTSLTVNPQFDLATTISGPTTGVAGSPLTLNVTTTNNGPQAATSGAVETVTLTPGLTNVYVSGGGYYNASTTSVKGDFTASGFVVSTTGGTTISAGQVQFPPFGVLPTNQTIANTITFSAPNASFSPQAQVTLLSGDSQSANNSAFLNGAANSTAGQLTSTAATGTPVNVFAILDLASATLPDGTAYTGSTAPRILPANTQVTYTVGAGNGGNTSATTNSAANVTQTLQLIPGLTASTLRVGGQTGTVSATNANVINFSGITTTDGSGVTYTTKDASYNTITGVLTLPTATTLATDNSTTTSVVVTLPTTVANNGRLVTTMSVGSSTPDAIASDNVLARTLRVAPTTDVTTTIVGPASVMAGQTVSYAATFTNAGPDGAAYTAQTLQLPTGLSGVVVTDQNGSTNTGATYDPATGLVTLPVITNYEVGAVQVFNVSFPAPAQNYTVSSAISTTTTDTAPANNAATVATIVGPMADVAVAIAGPPTAVAGNPVTYTVTTSNRGPVAASSLATTLQLPASLSNVSTSGSYNSNTGLVTFNTIDPLPAGGSAVNYATFTMPAAASGTQSVTGTASVSTSSTDIVSSNNTAGITTSTAPATNDVTNLAVTIPTAPASTVTAGSTLSYQFNFTNTGSNPAAGVIEQASLPTGLTAAGLTVANSTGTLANGVITFGNGTTYSQATGLLNFPAVSSLAASGSNAYAVSFPAPGNGPVLVLATISSNTSETTLTDNQASTSSAITASYDAITSLNGPATALPGTSNVYEVTTANNGPSVAPSITQTVTLPANLTPATLQVAGRTGTPANGTITYTNAAGATIATYSTSSGVLTFTAISNLAPGAASAITNTFAVTMPASGSLALTANVTSSGESNTNNNSATYTTTIANRPPVTRNVVNSLQSARANNAVALPISPLNAVDSDGTVASYTITSAPNSGTLYYNGSTVTDGTVITDPTKLTYVPASGFIGNAFFSYTATDNNSATSAAPSLYTIPVAPDQSSAYTATPQKGGNSPYQNNDVLTYIIDPNGAVYNNAGLVYNTNGTAATATGNLALANGVTSAALAANGPSGNTSNTLPAGVSLNLTTGQLFVSDRTKLRAGNYSVNITTTDANGGSNTLTESFTIGTNPLPVELVAFTAQAVQNRDGLLKWTTASELHNDHFELERSLDGTSFAKIGQVAGQGSKTSATDYTFTDAGIAAKVPAGQPVYYRLKQVDQDGTTSYSPVRTVNFTGTVVATIALYPNPAVTATGLDFSALPATGTYQVLLVDAAGRQVRQLTLAGGQVQPLDLHELASGTYSVLVTGQQADGSRLRQVLRLIKE